MNKLRFVLPILTALVWLSVYPVNASTGWSACISGTNNTPKQLHSLLFGVNMLYFNENDELRALPGYQQLLRAAGISALRFPGGVVADNYHWETGKSERINRRPKGHAGSGKDLNFDEFIVLAKSLPAEPTIVLNYLSWLEKNQLDKAYQEAVAWLKYANSQSHNAIRYWEFGNEVYEYLPDEHVTAKARDYARHYKAMRQALRAVEPSIKLGAAMPEKLNLIAKGDNELWWDGFLAEVGSDLDYLVLHQYPALTVERFISEGTGMPEWLDKLHNRVRERLGRQVPVHITEWNIALWDKQNKRQLIDRDSIWQGLFVAETLLDFSEHDVELAMFWPLRTEKGAGLLATDNQRYFIAGEVFKLLAPYHDSRIVFDCKQPGLRVTRLDVDQRSALVVINKKAALQFDLNTVLSANTSVIGVTQIIGADADYRVSSQNAEQLKAVNKNGLSAWPLLQPGVYVFELKSAQP